MNLTTAALGKLLGVSRPHISRLEHSHTRATAELAVLMEIKMGLPRWKIRPDLFVIGMEECRDD